MRSDQDIEHQKAKSYALRLLKLRPRSTLELRQKLSLKGYDALADDIVEELTRLKFLDDEAFAKAWLQYRLNKPMGYRRIAHELADKGIPKELVRSHWDIIKENYDELDVIRSLAQARCRKYINIDPLKQKKRVMDYLIRRGFQLDIIMKVIREL
ncbi:MAG: regulatory protein RecX [Candidatus Omnitrophota bacterium]